MKSFITLVNGRMQMKPETYKHTQNLAATTWTVNHNLGKQPSITVVDSAGTEMTASVNFPDDNTAVISLSYAISGEAFAN